MSEPRIYRIGELTASHPHWIGKIRVTHVDGVTVPGDCWLWMGAISAGYGRVTVNKKCYILHRYVYEHLAGPIPDRLQLDHLCRQLPCCNPAHLEPVTPLINVRRGIGHGSEKQCPRGHAYEGENLHIYKGAKGGDRRVCKQCRRDYMLAYHAKRKAQREATWAKYMSEVSA